MRVTDAAGMRGLLTILIAAFISVHPGASADSFASLSAAPSGGSSTGGLSVGRQILPEHSHFDRALETPAAATNVPAADHQVPRILAELAELQMQHRQEAITFAAMESTTPTATPVPASHTASLISSDQPVVSQPTDKRTATSSLRNCMMSSNEAKPFTIQDFIGGKAAM